MDLKAVRIRKVAHCVAVQTSYRIGVVVRSPPVPVLVLAACCPIRNFVPMVVGRGWSLAPVPVLMLLSGGARQVVVLLCWLLLWYLSLLLERVGALRRAFR